MLIFSQYQDWCRPNILHLDVSSKFYACIALNMVQRSQYVQDIHDLCLLDQWARRILFVSCLNPYLQVSIRCWWSNEDQTHILCGKYVGIIHTELSHFPVTKDQWYFVLSVLEELGGKDCSWKIRQYWYLLLDPPPAAKYVFQRSSDQYWVLWKFIPKIKLDSPELDCSVIFSLYRLTVSKKIHNFLRDFVRRERRFSWFTVNPLSFIHRNDAWHITRFSLLWFCFCLWSGCNNSHTRLWRLFFR